MTIDQSNFAIAVSRLNIGRDLSAPVHYHTFLTRLLNNGNVDHNQCRDAITKLGPLTQKEIMMEMKKTIARNPFGVIKQARKLGKTMRADNAVLGSNETDRRCLGELIQTVRTEAGLARDNSNNKANYLALWKEFINAKEKEQMKHFPLVDDVTLAVRSRRLQSKATRCLRKRESMKQLPPNHRIPSWFKASDNSVTENWCYRKLDLWARRSRTRIDPRKLRETKEAIKEQYRKEEIEYGNNDSNTLTIGLWNVDKQVDHVKTALSIENPSPIPTTINILCITEASGSERRTKPQVYNDWISSTIKNCQILVRKPATLTELEMVNPPRAEGPARDSTEFLACKVVTNKQTFTTISAYFPPSIRSEQHIKDVFRTFTDGCMQGLKSGPVIIGTDLNFHFGQDMEGHHLHTRLRKRIWGEVWGEALAGNSGTLTPLSEPGTPTHFPGEDGGSPACLDMIFLLTSNTSPAQAYPTKASVKPLQTAHHLTMGSFSIGGPQQYHRPEKTPIKTQPKWDAIRYDRKKQEEFRPVLESNLIELVEKNEFTPDKIAKIIVDIGKSELGTITFRGKGDGTIPKRQPGNGKAKRKNIPWWNSKLDQKARVVTTERRKVEECAKKIKKKLRVPPPTSTYELQKELATLRRKLTETLKYFRALCNKTRETYYNKGAASMSLKNPEHISTAHKIRRKVMKSRSGRSNEIQQNVGEMNKAWQTIFTGKDDEQPPLNANFLDLTLGEIREGSAAEEEFNITNDHIRTAIKGMALNKAPGLDGVANEALRLIQSEALIEAFAKMFSEMVNDPGKIAPEWKKGLIALIPKKENPDLLDYRPIALLSHLAKFMELAVKAYLEGELNSNNLIGVYQMGFREGRGTEEASLTLMAIDEICRQQDKDLIGIFLDIKKAYDSVPAAVLAASLKRLQIPSRLSNFLVNWVSGHRRKLLIPNNEGEEAWLSLKVGVPQGSILAPFLFACVMDSLHAYLNGEAVLGLEADTPSPALDIDHVAETWREIMYADDTTIFNHNIKDSNTMLRKIAKWSTHSGLDFHPKKFECLRLGRPYIRNLMPNEKFAPMDELGNPKSIRSNTYYGDAKTENRLPVVLKAKHLGLHKSFAGAPGPQFTINLTKRLKLASDSSEAIKFAWKVAKHATTAIFASNMHRVVVEGAAYFGCALCELNSKQIEAITTTIGKAAKAGLGIHYSAPTSLALSFLGWQKPETTIALRRLALLRRVLDTTTSPPATTALVKTMIVSNERLFPSPYIKLLNHSVMTVVEEEVRHEKWPQSRAEWVDVLNSESQVSLQRIDSIQKGIPLNHQHPMIRICPRHAAAAFRFILPTLKPYQRTTDGEADVCQVCNSGSNTGFHLLNECCHEKIKTITEGLLTNQQKAGWNSARQSGDYTELNRILKQEHSLTDQPDEVLDLVLIKPSGNDLDILARLLRHQLSSIRSTEGTDRFRDFLRTEKIEWQDCSRKNPPSQLQKYKSELYTAYYWLGIIVDKLWMAYCSRPDRRPHRVVDQDDQGDDPQAMEA